MYIPRKVRRCKHPLFLAFLGFCFLFLLRSTSLSLPSFGSARRSLSGLSRSVLQILHIHAPVDPIPPTAFSLVSLLRTDLQALQDIGKILGTSLVKEELVLGKAQSDVFSSINSTSTTTTDANPEPDSPPKTLNTQHQHSDDEDDESNLVVPNIVTFVFGLKGPQPPFHIENYLAVKSAHDNIKPTSINFYYHWEPTGKWWDMAKPMLTLKRVQLPQTVYGNKVEHFAHKADVIRMQAMVEHGGIYMDMDVIAFRDFKPFRKYDFVMGKEGEGGKVGLCNAILISRPNSTFARRWLSHYRTFDHKVWNYHSVELPKKLSQLHPSEIQVLDYQRFFWPLWDDRGIRKMFLEKSYDFKRNYAVHMWETASKRNFLRNLTPELLKTADTGLLCQLRKVYFGLIDPADEDCYFPAEGVEGHPDKLLGFWSFDEQRGFQVRDESGNRLHGVSWGKSPPIYAPANASWGDATRPSLVTSTSQNPEITPKGSVLVSGAAEGSHVFLPFLSGTSSAEFTVSLWFLPTGLTRLSDQDIFTISSDDFNLRVSLKVYLKPRPWVLEPLKSGGKGKYSRALAGYEGRKKDKEVGWRAKEGWFEHPDMDFLFKLTQDALGDSMEADGVKSGEGKEERRRRLVKLQQLEEEYVEVVREVSVSMDGYERDFKMETMEGYALKDKKLSVTQDKWNHVAFTMSRSEGRARLYLNSQLAAESRWDTDLDLRGIWLGTNNLYNVRGNWSTDGDFIGRFDSVMAFGSALRPWSVGVLAKPENRYDYTDAISTAARSPNELLDMPSWISSKSQDPIFVFDAYKPLGYSLTDLSRSYIVPENAKPFVNINPNTESMELTKGKGTFNVLKQYIQDSKLPYLAFDSFAVSWYGKVSRYLASKDGAVEPLFTVHFSSKRRVSLVGRRWGDCPWCSKADVELVLISDDNGRWDWHHPGQHVGTCRFREASWQHVSVSWDQATGKMDLYCGGVHSNRFEFRYFLWVESVEVGPAKVWDDYRLSDFRVFSHGLKKEDVRRLLARTMPIWNPDVQLSVRTDSDAQQIVTNGRVSEGFRFDTPLDSTALIDSQKLTFQLSYPSSVDKLTPVIESANTDIVYESKVALHKQGSVSASVLGGEKLSKATLDVSLTCTQGGESVINLLIPQLQSVVSWKVRCPEDGRYLWEMDVVDLGMNGYLSLGTGKAVRGIGMESDAGEGWGWLMVFAVMSIGTSIFFALVRYRSQGRKIWKDRKIPYRYLRMGSQISFATTCGLLILVTLQTILSQFSSSSTTTTSLSQAPHLLKSNPMPFISIIIPCYNQGIYLSDAVRSAVFQTYGHWEAIIVDDGSPDNCTAVGNHLKTVYPDKRIRVYRKENNGLSSARNFGISRAMGNWIMCLDADDMVKELYLQRAVEAIRKYHGNVHLVYAKQQFFGESNWRWDMPPFSHQRLLVEGILPVQTIFRRQDWASAGGFNEILPWGDEDWAFWQSISSLGPNRRAVKIDEYLILYRYKRQSMQREQGQFQELKPLMSTLQPYAHKVHNLLEDHSTILRVMCLRTALKLIERMCRVPDAPITYFWLGMYFERHRDFEFAMGYYMRAIQLAGDMFPEKFKPMQEKAETILDGVKKQQQQQSLRVQMARRNSENGSGYFGEAVEGLVSGVHDILEEVKAGDAGRLKEMCGRVVGTKKKVVAKVVNEDGEEVEGTGQALMTAAAPTLPPHTGLGSFSRFLTPLPPSKPDWQAFWRMGTVYAKLGLRSESKQMCQLALSLRKDLKSKIRFCYDLSEIAEVEEHEMDVPLFGGDPSSAPKKGTKNKGNSGTFKVSKM
ncbi:hypothetical protein HDV05_004579 [Chytridiales sp. JEL 0842]|nr:hypothetical protein HDV05_004579 [Chytridiales sp. JEL 0842]